MNHEKLWPQQQPITWEIKGSQQGLQGCWLCPFCREHSPWQVQGKASFSEFTNQLVDAGIENHWNQVNKP